MARIVYGISGEGSGHSSRAREVMTHLLSQGHAVRAVSYDRGYRNLKEDFDVFETEGLHIASEDNKVSKVKTFVDNIGRLPSGMRKLRELKRECFEEFQPHCVLTDFEPMTAYLAMHFDRPLVTLDNQHRMRYMDYTCPPELEGEARITEAVIRAIVPTPDLSLVTTFYFGRVRNERTLLFPPILRRAVRDLTPSRGGHHLVYTTAGFPSLLTLLPRFPRERFVVYGASEREGEEGNVAFRPPSQEGFLADLASARSVLATAGFTLMTESLHLRKPYLALPMHGQFEQELNALLLEELGYGRNGRALSAELVGDFFYRLPDYEQKLLAYEPQDNSALFQRLDTLLEGDAREAQQLHDRRPPS